MQKVYISWIFDKISFKFKHIFTCYISVMFYANALLHGISFDPRSSFTWNMTLTIGIPSHIKKQGLFIEIIEFIAYTKSNREKK